MIKRTLYFGNPARLFTRNEQLCIVREDDEEHTVPIEDVGFVIIDHDQVNMTKPLMVKLTENNSAIVITDDRHMPAGMFLPLESHTVQHERITAQISATLPLKKRLWQQTIRAKVRNQGLIIQKIGLNATGLIALVPKVKSGDPGNIEAVAARRYWKLLFSSSKNFIRTRNGTPPNNLLNYGYAILRAIIARSLIGAGLLPLIGIYHRNRYNAFPLADDIMEPYRPFVDELVYTLWENENIEELTLDAKKVLLSLPRYNVKFNGENSPLMVAATHTAVSLYNCFAGKEKTILYPEPWD